MRRVNTILAIVIPAKGIIMKQSLSAIGFVLVVAAACVSCDKLKPPLPELQKSPTASGQTSQQEGERKAFSQSAQTELDDLKATIAEFRAKAEASNAKRKASLGEEVGKLEADLHETEQRLTELKAAALESWNQVQESFKNSLEKLKHEIENFRKNSA